MDGHGDHTGAYPADVYYADMNGVWTDQFVNNISAGDPRNHNIPGDGKFDQASIPTDVELQIGRVDFFNMPSFALSEQELLRQYLDKDHAYRHKLFTASHRAVVDDNFGYFGGEAFAASGYKNFGPLVGNNNIVTADYFTSMQDSSYLWSYGCGGGWYQGAGGVGTTGQFANSSLETVFTMLFGSYFGDWDTPDNFLRAPLAQGKTLTNVWSGRPHW
ncbi:MAG: fibronectin type III domain-containing protein, partial [Saprospiraceae bacterium]